MKLGVLQKVVLLLAVVGVTSLMVMKAANASQTQKIKILWGEEIAYQLSTVDDRRVSYDGTAFVVKGKSAGEEVNRVIINTAFFEKEAGEIWEMFSSGVTESRSGTMNRSDLSASLIAIEQKISEGNGLSGSEKKEVLAELELLDRELRIAAWHPVYLKARQSSGNSAAARRNFVKMFTDIRKSTIEFHELSHLLDERRMNSGSFASLSERERKIFARESEIRAFVTELAYGCNPRDSLWQAVSGVRDEIRQGRDVDASLSKFAGVLVAAEKTGILDVRGIVACLCTLSNDQSRRIALRLYDRYRVNGYAMIPAA